MNAPRHASRQRRREVEDRLAAYGLVARPHRVSAAAGLAGESFAVRLHGAFAEIGPVFQLFGHYLAQRPDFLPGRDCLELAALPARQAPAPGFAVREQLSAELGWDSAEIFAAVDQEPFRVTATDSSYYAGLPDGSDVVVKVIHPHLQEEIARDREHLALVARAFRGVELAPGAAPLAEVISDFERALEARLDMTTQAAALEFLARDAADSDLLAVPEVYSRLSTPRVLTTERLDGVDLVEGALRGPGPARAQDLARRLSLLWLQQALVARTFPIEAEVLELRDGRLAIVAGTFAHLPAASQPNLWEYLRASAAHDPDEACDLLLRELIPATKKATERQLHLRLRQIVPFRDGCWSERGDTVAEHLVLHWQLARACGFEPRLHLFDFYRGIFWITGINRRLAPRADPLREAHEDMKWLAGWKQFRQFVDPKTLGPTLEDNVASWLELPQKLDQVLNMATGDEGRLRLQVEESPVKRQNKSSSAIVISLALMMVALAMLADRLTAFEVSMEWIKRLITAAFLVLGAGLLWVTSRR